MELFDVRFTPEELQRVCWVRAIEWLAWPAFLSQPLLPILYTLYPVYWVVAAITAAGLFWLPFRYHLVSLRLATLGCFWVRLKWITIPIGVFVLLRQGRFVAAAIALGTPWISGLLNIPGEIGVVERKFWALANRSASAPVL